MPKRTSSVPESPFCSVRQFVRRSGLSEYYVRSMIKSGVIPVTYSGAKAIIHYDTAVNAVAASMSHEG